MAVAEELPEKIGQLAVEWLSEEELPEKIGQLAVGWLSEEKLPEKIGQLAAANASAVSSGLCGGGKKRYDKLEVNIHVERLQKILANAGIASRRKCEELITAGKVTVNGEVRKELGFKANPAADVIAVDGRPIQQEKKLYLLFYKPKGVITSVTDPKGRTVVSDFIKGVKERVYPVGRLDYDTEGLLLLTNDGELAHKLTHPKHHVAKTYHATVERVPHGSALEKLKKGIKLEDGITAPAEVEYYDVDPAGKFATVSITIREGRNRQVRRMFEAIHHPVVRLKRISFGGLSLGGLQRGKHRALTAAEVQMLHNLADAKELSSTAEGKQSANIADAKQPGSDGPDRS